jgi:hypothetical protein
MVKQSAGHLLQLEQLIKQSADRLLQLEQQVKQSADPLLQLGQMEKQAAVHLPRMGQMEKQLAVHLPQLGQVEKQVAEPLPVSGQAGRHSYLSTKTIIIMKKIIIRFHFQSLHNDAHVAFNNMMDYLFVKHNPEALGIAALYAVFKALLTEEVAALDIILRSRLTEVIDRLDLERDSYWRGLVTATRGYLRHFDPGMREAAHQLTVIFKHYGNIARRGIDAKTAVIEDLHTELMKPENLVYITALGLGEWLGSMVQASRSLEEQMKMRYAEIGKRPDVHMRSLRTRVDRALRDIFDRVVSLVNVHGEADYSAFLAELNAVTERERDLLAQGAGRRHPVKDLGAGDHCMVEPVGTQQYTAKAVTPLPKAWWREEGKPAVELVFAKDFSVTYKNNVEVGTAEVTLHVKGDYRGRFDVTFNITS